MAEYVLRVGKKGELYTPKKMRSQIGMRPGNEFVAVIAGEKVILEKRKTIVDLLEEDVIATVSEEEIKDGRKILEKELLER
ncbi:MAG: hypothetical protein U9N09_01840 [Euryarchaeota archaeon]|nr:hypothetical protein [Euryarchaeota archaeon]